MYKALRNIHFDSAPIIFLSQSFFLQLNSLVISHFRKQIMSPFLAINAVGDYDVRSEVLGGGHSGEKFRPLVSLHFDFSL